MIEKRAGRLGRFQTKAFCSWTFVRVLLPLRPPLARCFLLLWRQVLPPEAHPKVPSSVCLSVVPQPAASCRAPSSPSSPAASCIRWSRRSGAGRWCSAARPREPPRPATGRSLLHLLTFWQRQHLELSKYNLDRRHQVVTIA